VSLRGAIATMPVDDVFEWAARRKVTVRLVVERDQVVRTFWLADGAAVTFFSSALVLLGWRFGAAALPYVRAFGGYALLAIAAAVTLWLIVSRLSAAKR